jgi:glycosyltransferase involved in cell wall biosynthesis
MNEDPAITVVIPTRNRPELVSDAIESVMASDYPSFEVLVSDQSSDCRTQNLVKRIACKHSNLHYVSSSTVGSSMNRNLGASLCRTEFIAYTDDDCIVDPNWISSLMTELTRPGISAVYGRVLPFNRDALTGAEAAVRDGLKYTEFRKKVPPWYVGTGGNMAFRCDALSSIGGFDPLLGAGSALRSCEDTDIAYRLLSGKRSIVYVPKAVVYHKLWKDWRSQQQMERAYGIGAGAQFTKYVRCSDMYGAALFLTWIWQHGVRRFGAGLFKWRNPRVLYMACCQLVYPWLGMLQSARFEVDLPSMTYVIPADEERMRRAPSYAQKAKEAIGSELE